MAADQSIALDVKTPALPPVQPFDPASQLENAQSILGNQTKLQMLNRQNAGEDIQFRNQLVSNAAAHALDADSWDAAMREAVQKGAPEAAQYVGRYTPLLQQRLFDAYSGSGGAAGQGAAPAAATGGIPTAGAATPTDQLDRMYQNVSPEQMAQSLQKNNMILQALSTVKDADSYNHAIGWLAQNGIPNAAQIAGPYNPLQVLRLWNDTQGRVAYLQSRVSAASTGQPAPLVKNEVQNIGDVGYSVDPYKGTAKPITPMQPKTIQDPIMGPRTILPDQSGQWHYADTGEAVVPSQAPTSGGISIEDAAKRIQPTENATGNPAATNPRSTAMGNDQFIEKTFLNTVKAAKPPWAEGLNDKQILAMRAVPGVDAAMTTELAKQNAPVLAQASVPVTSATIALAHHFGTGTAIKIYDANQNTPMEQIVSADVLKANPELKGQTAGAYVQNLVKQVGNDPVNTNLPEGAAAGQAPLPGIPPSDDPARPFKNATTLSGATMIKAQQMGLHGQAFLDALPSQLRNDIEAVGNYDQPLTIFSKMGRAGMSQDRALSFVRQFNPDYDGYWATAKGQSLKEFVAGGPSSPAAQIRSYNTAIGHAGDAYDALQEMKRINPGFLQDAQNAGIPFVSYAAAQLQNKAIQGTPMGAALNKYVTASTLYGAEAAKLYSGSAGSQEERNTIRGPLDQNKSLPEIEAGLQQSVHMMGSRAGALEDQYKVAMDAPGLAQYGTKGALKDFPVLHDRAQAVLAKVGTGNAPAANAPPVPGAKFYQGNWYTRGPNGEAVPYAAAKQ